ncbi:PadR family transcriptional regulator [Oceanobacillus profundus]|uniref:PadR family transcriptional regulator n=1 Tax=Oceanobacillus profundus TaxID=372463 RepID=UPI000BA58D37|nr:PadR family transcriptional regulator [Oceanobacillus profundus]MCM3397242.1 PadR family transcriptional regulator [Oceanobacillus profundus]PAE28635.1 PadR family transcriptional regulator [Paenibacillus sp. 7884-2]
MENDKWQLQFKKGVIELTIMLLIQRKPLYGYEITSTLKNTSYLSLSDGAIYPILKRLENNKWSYSFWDDPEDGPRRKYYQLTEKGKEVLENRIQIFNESSSVIKTIKGAE